jgi:hypothetical protein
MVQRYLDRPVAVAALAAVVVGCLIPLSKVDAQATNEVASKKKVEQFLLGFQKETGLPVKELKTSIQFVDLNSDGTPEALVIINDQQWCGSHGCGAFVLDLSGPAAKDIGDFTAFDLQPLSSRTRGWRDISVIGTSKGNRVRFNGRAYSGS